MQKNIGSVVQKGSSVYVYDEKGSMMFTKSGELHGFTSTTVSVKKGRSIYVYDSRGSTKFTKSTG